MVHKDGSLRNGGLRCMVHKATTLVVVLCFRWRILDSFNRIFVILILPVDDELVVYIVRSCSCQTRNRMSRKCLRAKGEWCSCVDSVYLRMRTLHNLIAGKDRIHVNLPSGDAPSEIFGTSSGGSAAFLVKQRSAILRRFFIPSPLKRLEA